MTRFGSGIRSEIPGIVAAIRPTSVVCVADERVIAHHGWPAEGARILLQARESNKNLKEWERILDELVSKRVDRDGLLLALGGGVTLDLAGFVAATYLRGIRWIALPTTLLAQVDAAHGGKTGVDHAAAKNLVGAFHPPEEVLADTDYLATLSDRDMRNGLAEVIKHGILRAPRSRTPSCASRPRRSPPPPSRSTSPPPTAGRVARLCATPCGNRAIRARRFAAWRRRRSLDPRLRPGGCSQRSPPRPHGSSLRRG